MNNVENILNFANGYKISNILFWASKNELFNYLVEAIHAADLAKLLNVDKDSLKVILEILHSIGLLDKNQEQFQIRKEYQSLLDKNSETSMLSLLALEGYLSESYLTLTKLDQAIKSGEGCDQFNKNGKENQEKTYGEAMEKGARFTSLYVAREFKKIASGDILDIGGSLGHYAVQIVKANKQLHVDVLDKEEMRQLCEKNIRKHNMKQQISFQAADILEYDFEKSYDGILISNVLHLLNKQERNILYKKVISILKPGGILVFHDFFVNTQEQGITSSIFLYDWLLNGSKFCLSLADMEQIAKRNELKVVKSRTFSNVPTSIIIVKKGF
jgi:Cyclopropane fatty acid synthase and related methyltransferases